jgi:type I restriction enzyme R subunit
MSAKEATARIKINKLLEAAGWRFFPEGPAPANIRLEPAIAIQSVVLDALGADFEKVERGFVDFLLLDARGVPLIVLEAKAEQKNPLTGKEQARKYARSQNCRFVILSNGNLHYFWDLERGNPYVITSFPTPTSVIGYQKVTPNPLRLFEDQVGADYIVRTQRPNYEAEAGWRNETERPAYIQANKLRFLRPYQLQAIRSLQAAVGDGKDRFLFEMATGTGKTLTAAAVIKLFLRSGNVRRVLFLVDRLELEDQAKKSFAAVLSADYQTVIYKENRDDWQRAEIVVTTVREMSARTLDRALDALEGKPTPVKPTPAKPTPAATAVVLSGATREEVAADAQRIMGLLSAQLGEMRQRKGSLTGASKQRVLAAIEQMRSIVLKWPAWATPKAK